MTNIYDFEVNAADGTVVSLQNYAGEVLLIVNTASKCGLTPQYEGLEKLYRAHRQSGFWVLGFPCNQFLGQEPGTDEEIQNFCKTVYDVSFPVFARVDVNGPESAPLYDFLRSEMPTGSGSEHKEFVDAISKVNPDPKPGDVLWNFTKFLINRDGVVVERYEPPVEPVAISADLRAYL